MAVFYIILAVLILMILPRIVWFISGIWNIYGELFREVWRDWVCFWLDLKDWLAEMKGGGKDG